MLVKSIAAIALLVAGSAVAFAGDGNLPSALRELVERERSFAARCGEIGVRASFLEFFADDAMAFTPEPVRYKEAVKDLPPPENPLAVRLEWEPQAGDISASSDLGYTTGPSVRTNTGAPDEPKRYGQFLSVWKKQADGTWKVAVDIGVSTPAQASSLGTPFRMPRESGTMEEAASDNSQGPMDIDRKFSELCTSTGVLNGYLSRTGEEVRLYRANRMPMVSAENLRSYLAGEIDSVKWSPVGGDISRARDLCYAYGSYELERRTQSGVEKGYYLHVWKRNSEGEWKLVADAARPIDQGK